MILTDRTLEVALARTQHPIALLDANLMKVRDLVLPEEVATLIAAGYEAGGSKRRVRYLKPSAAKMAIRAELPFKYCYRTTESAVLWPWDECAA